MARTKQTARRTHHRVPFSFKRPRQASVPYVAIKKPRLVYEKYLKHDSIHVNIRFSTNAKYSLPNEVFQLILSFVPTHVLLSSCRRVCRSFKNIIDNTFAFWRWRLIENSMQFEDGKDLLESDVTWRTCRLPLLIRLQRDGLFESRKRDINRNLNPNNNYTDLMILGNFLLHEHEQLELRLPNAKYNISFLSVVRGAHSPGNMYPIVIKHDIDHRIRHEHNQYEKESLQQYITEYPWYSETIFADGLEQSISQGSIMFQTVKKMFRFPSYETEYRGGKEFDELWEQQILVNPYPIREPLDQYLHVYDDLKRRMEQFFGGRENTSFIQVGNTASEEVALCFWLGIRGSYVGGYCWMHERDS